MATIPQSIPNLVLWLDGNDPAGNGTPPANSAVITTWVDKSTSAANGTTTGKATYQTSFANGYGSVNFGTAGVGYIQNTSFTLTLSSKTFFMVCSSFGATTHGDPAGFMSFGNSGNVYDQQNGTAYQGPESAYTNKFGFLQAFGNGGYYTSYGSPFGETPLAIYGDTQSGTAATVYVNGSVLANNTLSYTPGTSTQYRIGRRTDGLGQYLYGNVCEVLVYTGVLSTANRQKVEGYLAWKWGLQASLPSGHPYLSAAPGQAPTTPFAIPANTSLLLVNTSSISKTFTLPPISTNQGRLLIFKDIYGSFSTNNVKLSTTGLDGFENNGSTMVLNTNYGAWTFLNDAVTRWYLVDSYKNTMLVSTFTQVAVSSQPTAFTSFRWTITAGNTESLIQFAEFQVGYNNTQVVFSSPTTATTGSTIAWNTPGEGPAQAVDNNINTKGLGIGTSGLVLIVTVASPITVNMYRWATANDVTPGRNPTQWTVDGSTDNVNFIRLHTQNTTYAGPNSTFTFISWIPFTFV
jgi:hypothetical protein